MGNKSMIPEELKPITGTAVGVAGNAASTFDWINCKGAHTLYCVVNIKRATATFDYLLAYSGSDSAATGSSAISTGINYWYRKGTMDRITKYTDSTYGGHLQCVSSNIAAGASSGPLMLIAALDLATVPTSHPWVAFALKSSSQVGNLHYASYFLDSRYKGYQQFIATTSST